MRGVQGGRGRWWGLEAETAAKAERLSALGYAVFAPDMYRGQAAEYVGRTLWLRLTVPEDRVMTDLDGALTAADVPHTVTVYPGVGHAFVKTGALDAPGAAADAWAELGGVVGGGVAAVMEW